MATTAPRDRKVQTVPEQTQEMAEILAPFRSRRVVLVAIAVALLTLGALLLFAPRVHEGARLVSAVLLSCAFGSMAAAAVLFLRVSGMPKPGSVLDGLDTARRRDVGRAVIRGADVRLSESEEPHAVAFARAYRDWLPRWTAPYIALMLGLFLEALAQLRTWDGGFMSVLLVLEFALVLCAGVVLVPLQVRRIARAERFLAGRPPA
ncbi:hypothetical protein ACLBWP_04900 [Microbacterium sp. M1A1_1b]